jgi:mono/diheme cytochrome c family protein
VARWLCVGALLAACGDGATRAQRSDAGPTPAGHAVGAAAYDASCRSCHGPRGTGTTQGPPLVHRIYEPAHHSDAAFRLAVRRGVRAHHWRYGDMPPVGGIDDEALDAIIAYVRWLQQAAGIE